VSSYKTVKKVSSPGISNTDEYAINIYKGDKFVVSYRYPGWTKEAVDTELYILTTRFPNDRGFNTEIG
jgi:hypothetical protein